MNEALYGICTPLGVFILGVALGLAIAPSLAALRRGEWKKR